jgi:hypothetical protein
METPKIIFIDTCIFDANQYNFHSSGFESIKKTFKKGEVTLVVPAPTQMEILKHIENMSKEIAKALTKAQQQAPFLTKLEFWPDKKSRTPLGLEARQSALKDLREFYEFFNVVRLDYEEVSLPQVMHWHSESVPPFSEKKPNEFRDAITLSALLGYQKKEDIGPIAIISSDNDFKEACLDRAKLLYFASIDKYIESTLKASVRVEDIRVAIESEELPLYEKVSEKFPALGFTHDEDWDADIEDVEVTDVTVTEYSIIQVGDEECVLSADLDIGYNAAVTMEDPDGGRWARKLSGTVSDTASVKSLIKCKMSTDFHKADSIISVSFPDNDTLTVTEKPEPESDFYDEDM